MGTTNNMEQLLRRRLPVTVKDVKLGDGYYEVDAIYWGDDHRYDGKVLIKFEGLLLSVLREKVAFKDEREST